MLYQVRSTPERVSAPVSETVGPDLYQPLLLSTGGRLTVVVGAVRSTRMPVTLAVVELPALSLTVASAPRSAPSPVTVLFAGQPPSIPERSSEQVQCTVTSPLYQPVPFGPVVAAPVSTGAVLSTLMPVTVYEAVLPAASETSPEADWSVPSPRVTGLAHDFTPERLAWSSQVKVTVTSPLYQSLRLAARSADPLIVGSLLSMLTVAGSVAELPALSSAVPGSGWSLPSFVSVIGAVQDLRPEPPVSSQTKVIVT